MKKTMTYADAKSRLELILSELQNNQLTIDELSSKINEAVGLIDFCKNKLRSVDLEVEKVLKKTDG